MIELLLYIVSLAILIIGTYTDLKIREVPDWANYGGIAIGLLGRAVWSIAAWDKEFIISGLIGFTVFFVVGWAMYLGRQWGGGDSKLFMAIGALLGIKLSSEDFVINFFSNAVIVGAVYGLLWTLTIVVRNWKTVKKEWKNSTQIPVWKRKIVIAFCGVLLVISFLVDKMIGIFLLLLALTIFVGFYLLFFVKTIEQTFLVQKVSAMKVTEGDWIAKDIIVKGKLLCGTKTTGITKEQLEELQKFYDEGKVKQVWIRTGIPFVPAVLAAFLLTFVLKPVVVVMEFLF